MASGKKSFMFYCDWKETFESLPDEKAGELIKHVLRYVNDENPETDDILIKAVFANIKATLKRDLKKWEKIVERNRKNGALGGRPPGTKQNPDNPVGFLGTQNNPEKPDSDSDSDSDKESTNVDKKKSSNGSDKNNELMMQIVNNQTEHQTWIETAYRKYKLDTKKLGVALKDFNDSMTLMGVVKPNLKEYKTHFFNWMNVQETKGNLASLKK